MVGTAAEAAHMDEPTAEAARVTQEDLRRLVAMLARGSSCLGGLPIHLRAELSCTLHLVELYYRSRYGISARSRLPGRDAAGRR